MIPYNKTMQYDYLLNPTLTLENLNASADQGWTLQSIQITDSNLSDKTFLITLEKGLNETYMEKVDATNDTDASFYLSKTLTYGDIVLFVFLTMFLVWSIIKCLWSFIYPSNFKR